MRNKNPSLEITAIADLVLRRNFEQLRNYFDLNGQFDGFKLLEFTVTKNETNLKIEHNLGYIPKDVIVSRLIGPTAAIFTVNHGKNTTTQLDITVTGLAADETVECRMFVGSYKGRDSAVTLPQTSLQRYGH